MSNSVITYQVLLDIQQMLKAQSDPDFLKKAAVESYALTASEQKKAAQAKADISANKALLDQIKAEQDKLADLSAALNQKKKEIEDKSLEQEKDYQTLLADISAKTAVHDETLARAKASLADLATYKATLDDQAAQNTKDANDLVAERNKFVAEVASHETAKKALADKQSEIDLYEKNLKARAAKLREQTEGL